MRAKDMETSEGETKKSNRDGVRRNGPFKSLLTTRCGKGGALIKGNKGKTK